nr:hypothetical protein BaRGS_012274 [Batillaria attramentaria]
MRITCEVDTINRLLPALNLKKPSRSSHAQVSVGRSSSTSSKDATLFVMVCTAKDRNGNKYLIQGNIGQIFAKFVSEGKATIRFKEPEEDLCISKADPLQLRSLLSIVRHAAQGGDLSKVTLSTLQPASTASMKKLQSKMVITTRKDYPLTTTFPSSLQHLQVHSCGMKRLDSRILQLRKLQTLDLFDNLLTALPDDPGRWSTLKELRLAKNQFTTLPPVLWQSSLKETLAVLDVSGNQLKTLPLQVCEIKGLVQLLVDNNKITAIPPTIGALSKLCTLSATNNAITRLPACITRLPLESLDLFGNPLELPAQNIMLSSNLGVPSLVETAARAIRTLRVAYGAEDLLPHLIHYLNNARLCC